MKLIPGRPLGPWCKDWALSYITFLRFPQGSLARVGIRAAVVGQLREVEAAFAGSGPVTPSTCHATNGPLRPGAQT